MSFSRIGLCWNFKSDIVVFFGFFLQLSTLAVTDCTQSRPVKKTQLESGLPTLWGPRTPQPNPRSHACHGTAGSNQCVYISVRVCLQMRAAFSSCVHTRPAGIRCDGGRDQVPAESGEGTHMLGCRKRLLSLGLLLWRTWAYARRHAYPLRAPAQTTPKKHTSHTHTSLLWT